MAIALNHKPLSDVSDVYLNMKMETAHKRLAYQESIWAVKEIDLIEDKRKLQLRIAILEQDLGNSDKAMEELSSNDNTSMIQAQMRLVSEEKDRMHRDFLSLQKQLDYYKGETESLQKRMRDADNVLSEKMALSRRVITLETELENEKRATARTSKNAADRGDSEKALQKDISELKAQLTKQVQLTDKAKAEVTKVKEDWEKQKTVLESKLEKERGKNKNLQEKKTGVKRKAVDEAPVPSLLSPIKPSRPPAQKTVSITAPAPQTRKPIPKKPQPVVSEFSTTPFFSRQGSALPQPSPSIAANTSVMARSIPAFGGGKSKRVASVATSRIEESSNSTTLDDDPSLGDLSANASILTDAGVPKKKKRKLNCGTGNRTLLALPDESPAHGINEFGVSTLMMESPADRPAFAGKHLLSTVKKPKGGLMWNMKKEAFKFNSKLGGISPEKTNDKMKDIKRGFTLNL